MTVPKFGHNLLANLKIHYAKRSSIIFSLQIVFKRALLREISFKYV